MHEFNRQAKAIGELWVISACQISSKQNWNR